MKTATRILIIEKTGRTGFSQLTRGKGVTFAENRAGFLQWQNQAEIHTTPSPAHTLSN